jgi:hypothetical protein
VKIRGLQKYNSDSILPILAQNTLKILDVKNPFDGHRVRTDRLIPSYTLQARETLEILRLPENVNSQVSFFFPLHVNLRISLLPIFLKTNFIRN